MVILFLILCILPNTEPINDSFDLLERNHFYDGEGNEFFIQLIMWDIKDEEPFLFCQHFTLEKVGKESKMVIFWDFPHKSVLFISFNDKKFRRIHFKKFKESWTQEDPEMIFREKF